MRKREFAEKYLGEVLEARVAFRSLPAIKKVTAPPQMTPAAEGEDEGRSMPIDNVVPRNQGGEAAGEEVSREMVFDMNNLPPFVGMDLAAGESETVRMMVRMGNEIEGTI